MEKIMRSILFMVLVPALLAGCAAPRMATDSILLKSGQVEQGRIIKKTEEYALLDVPGKAAAYFLLSDIDTINGRAPQGFVVRPSSPAYMKRPHLKRGEKDILTVILKNGQEVRGEVLARDPRFLRLMLLDAHYVTEILAEDIQDVKK
ncbi:MAG: hypothetical protein HQL19_05460 [Candidatus Omnitrophica bacterium]|nr:hypothetical protein [Candidatus Omnitrophota bacterium]